MRIASLVPSATEMLFALGLGADVVAVTHECDFPPAARELPHLTATVLPEGLSAGEIDAAVKSIVGEGRALYSLDEERLAELEPELIVTQAVCDVCAVSFEDVVEVAARLPGRPRVVQQDPSSLGEVLEDVVRLGTAAGIEARARELRAELEGRLAAVRAAVGGTGAVRAAVGGALRSQPVGGALRPRPIGEAWRAPPVAGALQPQPVAGTRGRDPDRAARPRVIALEWLDPPFVGGHWIPEMIALAGGEDVAGPAGAKSPEVEWEALASLDPDLVVAMPCGMYVEESRQQAEQHWEQIEALGADRVFAVDAASTYSRPGPRLVDGTELLAHLLHPDLVDPPSGIGFAELEALPGL